MSDPAQLSSVIAELQAKTAGLTANGADGSFTNVTASGVVTADFAAQSVGAGLTAVGTNRATALALTAAINVITGAATGTGVELPDLSGSPGADVIIFQEGGEDIKVYAAGSQTIDGTAGSTGVTLTNGKRCAYYMTSATAWLSAQLGVASA